MSDQLAIEAARDFSFGLAKDFPRPGLEFALSKSAAYLGFMAGCAWQSAQAAKLLEGVVRRRDREPGDQQP